MEFKNKYNYINVEIEPINNFYIYANEKAKQQGYDNYLDYREYWNNTKEELEELKKIQKEIDMYLEELKNNNVEVNYEI